MVGNDGHAWASNHFFMCLARNAIICTRTGFARDNDAAAIYQVAARSRARHCVCLGWFAYFPVALQELSTDLCCNPVAEFETTEAEDAVLSCLVLSLSFGFIFSLFTQYYYCRDSAEL